MCSCAAGHCLVDTMSFPTISMEEHCRRPKPFRLSAYTCLKILKRSALQQACEAHGAEAPCLDVKNCWKQRNHSNHGLGRHPHAAQISSLCRLSLQTYMWKPNGPSLVPVIKPLQPWQLPRNCSAITLSTLMALLLQPAWTSGITRSLQRVLHLDYTYLNVLKLNAL